MYADRTHGLRSLVDLSSSWVSYWTVVIPRPIRRFLLIFLFFFLIFLLSGPVTSLYSHIVDFYLPTLTIPIKRDLSKLPVIKEQLISNNQRVIQPVLRKDHLFMLILISSGAAGEIHVRKRMAIRNTWGNIPPGITSWRVVFVLGTTNVPFVDAQRQQEAKQFGDILISDFPDTYRNITKKLMMAFHWAAEQEFEYLLKTDDDVYINVPSLIEWIHGVGFITSPLYAGVLYRANVMRDPNHRHYISWDDLAEKRFPWYPKGALYVLSGHIVKQMVTISTKVKQITVDDAYVGIMASYLGVQPIVLPNFIQSSFMPELLEYFDKCTYMNIFGMADNLTPKDIYFVHHQVLLARNSSKWTCIHVHHPLILAGVAVMILVLFWFILIRNSSAHMKQ